MQQDSPVEMGRPKAHMPAAMMMGVTEMKKRACVMVVFSMPSTHSEKCTASATPDRSISRPLSHVLRLRSTAVQSLKVFNMCSQHACAQAEAPSIQKRKRFRRATPAGSTMMPMSETHLPQFPGVGHCHSRLVSSVEGCDV